MDEHITDEEVNKDLADLKQALSRTDPKGIRAGVDAYKRELLELLAEKREGYAVAYCGGKRAAIAETHDKLQEILESRNLAACSDLFVTRVTGTDVEDYKIKR